MWEKEIIPQNPNFLIPNRKKGIKMNQETSTLTPKDFTAFPMSSVKQKCEAEQIAVNIMVILSRTGNTFRPLSWQEYVAERKKDGGFTTGEKEYFEEVQEYCVSAETAILFSKVWKKAAGKRG
jgi:hypothetical protein